MLKRSSNIPKFYFNMSKNKRVTFLNLKHSETHCVIDLILNTIDKSMTFTVQGHSMFMVETFIYFLILTCSNM